jgi:protein gp37
VADGTGIEWTDATWNPTVGCSVVSPGCTNCYAMKMAGRLEAMGSPVYRGHTLKTKAGFVWNGKVSSSNWGQIIKPLSWKKPRRVFVNSMSDLFHDGLPDTVIDQVFAIMALCPQHTFQVLTKRPERMREYCSDPATPGRVDLIRQIILAGRRGDQWNTPPTLLWPLDNCWLGTSVEDQVCADERVPNLLATPAAVHFLSCEPLLGPVDLTGYLADLECGPRVDWVIAGGESGPHRRQMDLAWARSLLRQCREFRVPFFGKQNDKVTPLPDDLMVREMPR